MAVEGQGLGFVRSGLALGRVFVDRSAPPNTSCRALCRTKPVAAHKIGPPDIQTTSDLPPTLHPDVPDLSDPPFTSGPRSTLDLGSESSATRLGLHRRGWHRGWRGCSRHGWWSVTVVFGRCCGPASPEERIQPAWGRAADPVVVGDSERVWSGAPLVFLSPLYRLEPLL
ncbi:hypothetical protein U1Q18_045185 [Sarracenia purpurea var. burkii]